MTLTLTYNSETKKIAEWAAIVGLDHASIRSRLKKGWSAERIITTPPQKTIIKKSPPLTPDFIRERSTPEPNSGCWLWELGQARFDGNGVVKHNRRQRIAHRVSYEIFHGPIPAGMFVCHKCDTPLCVNPDHLFLGTPKDNVDDMLRKGRAAHQKKAKAKAVKQKGSS